MLAIEKRPRDSVAGEPVSRISRVGAKNRCAVRCVADFNKCKTFAIRNGTLNSELIKKQIEADIRRDLTARGLTEAERPDLNVVYHFGSQQQDRA